ncbi:MAG: hypothetical protein R3C09_19760 [Pirellulaceae bacterium]
MFVIWHQTYDKIAPFMSNPNYAPKARVVENNLFGKLGYGTWISCAQTILNGLEWCRTPNELFVAGTNASTKSLKVEIGDPVLPGSEVHCGSSSEMEFADSGSIHLVITDSAVWRQIFHSDLANFFYA